MLIKRLKHGIQQTSLSFKFGIGQIHILDETSDNVRTNIKYIKGTDTFYIVIAIVDHAPAKSEKAPTQDAAS